MTKHGERTVITFGPDVEYLLGSGHKTPTPAQPTKDRIRSATLTVDGVVVEGGEYALQHAQGLAAFALAQSIGGEAFAALGTIEVPAARTPGRDPKRNALAGLVAPGAEGEGSTK